MKTMKGFEFERGVDSITTLTEDQLRGMVLRMVRRNFASVLSFHLENSLKKLDDMQELEAVAVELLEMDSKNQTAPLFVVYYEGEDEEDDQTMVDRFTSLATSNERLNRSTMTVDGQRTPIKPPMTTYKKFASSSRPGHYHTVELLGGVPIKCSCEGFFYSSKDGRDGTCRHIREASRR